MRRAHLSTPTNAVDVDGIVARYTALGQRERQSVKRRGRTRLALAVATVLGAAMAWVSGVPTALLERGAVAWLSGAPSALLDRAAPAGDDLRALHDLVSSEIERLGAARAELAAERDRYSANSAALEAELAAFAERHTELERQQAALTEQSMELRSALAAVEAERLAILANARTTDPAVERELAAIAAQRRQLEEQWASFSTQGRQLSDELALLEQRRDDLEGERAAMDQQRRELEALIESTTRAAGTTSRIADPRLDPTLEPMLANLVDGTELGDMRGGVQLANGMNIAIGLTRSASINGIEQYSSSLQLDDLSAGIGTGGLDGLGMNVIQNGAGNFVSPGVLDGLSSGFGTIIQNSLDNQNIQTLSTYDIAISDVGNTIRDIATGHAVSDSLLFNQ
jgi:hypothetical protein